MAWTTHHDGDYWKIESNLYSFEGDLFGYKYEKTFVRITCKDYVNQSVLTVNGVDYEFYADGEVSILEITDLIRAYSTGTVTFIDANLQTVLELEWTSYNGLQPSGANVEQVPEIIPFYKLIVPNPFYVQFMKDSYIFRTLHSSVLIQADQLAISENVNLYSDFANRVSSLDGVDSFFELISCIDDKIQVEWVSRFGQLKSWWFTIEKMIYYSDKQINLQTLDSGYSTIKNKRTSIVVSHKNADTITQQYLSDIVLSDDVYVYDSAKLRVKVETNNFEISKRKQDINFVINKNAYDTI